MPPHALQHHSIVMKPLRGLATLNRACVRQLCWLLKSTCNTLQCTAGLHQTRLPMRLSTASSLGWLWVTWYYIAACETLSRVRHSLCPANGHFDVL